MMVTALNALPRYKTSAAKPGRLQAGTCRAPVPRSPGDKQQAHELQGPLALPGTEPANHPALVTWGHLCTAQRPRPWHGK